MMRSEVLDFETYNNFTVTIVARDDGQPIGISSPTSVLINVLNRNDPPKIDFGQTLRAFENATLGTVIGRISITDPDKDDSHMFTDATIFEMPIRVDRNGSLIVSGRLDHEGLFSTVNLYASVIDSAGASDGPHKVEVVIDDSNDSPKVVLPTGDSWSLSENCDTLTSSTACMTALQVADADTRTGWGAPFTWQIVDALSTPKNDSCLDRFKINRLTGQLSYNSSSSYGLDFNKQPACTLDISVTDAAGSESPVARLTIHIEDHVDFPLLMRSSCNVFENATSGVNLADCGVNAVDPDFPPQYVGISLINSTRFILDQARLELRLLTALDYEVDGPSVSVSVRLEKFGLPAVERSYQIFIRDVNEPPEFVNADVPRYISENASQGSLVTFRDGLVGTVVIRDQDAGDVLTVSQINASASAFIYDSVQLTITYKGAPALDYESLDLFTVFLMVVDSSLLSSAATLGIKLTDVNEPPNIYSPAHSIIAYPLPIGNSVGVQLLASDPDRNETFTFVQVGTWTHYALNPANGEIRVASNASSIIGNETLCARVLDKGKLTSESTCFVLEALEGAKAPVISVRAELSILENTTTSTLIETVHCSAHAGRETSVKIEKYNGRRHLPSEEIPFAVSALDGKFTILKQLDFETQSGYHVLFICTDSLGLAATDSTSIYVKDVNEPPVGITTTWLAPEHTQPGAIIANVTARDEDKNDRQDGTLKFSVVDAGGAPIELQTTSVFDVPCGCSSAPLFLGSPGINFEDANRYQIQLLVTDHSGLRDEFSCLLLVEDENDMPRLDLESVLFSVPENIEPGASIGDVIIHDEDPADILSVYITAQDAGAGINFALVASDSPRRWSLVLRAGSLDFENLENHTIHLSLSDGHVTTTSSVVVRVIDVNDVTVTSVEALTGSGMLSTAGGERFSVLGSNFGSLHSDLSAVTSHTRRQRSQLL